MSNDPPTDADGPVTIHSGSADSLIADGTVGCAADQSGVSGTDAVINPPSDTAGHPGKESFDDDDVVALNPLVLAAIGLILLAAVPFLMSLAAPFHWLDDASITKHPFIRTNDGVARIWTAPDDAGRYEPLTLTSYWIEYRVAGTSPALYYAFNIFLHLLSVILLWTLLRRLNIPCSWIVAAVFAVHPIHVPSVAWLGGRGVLMSSTLYLAAALVYLRYVGITPVPPGSKTLMTLPSEPERLWGLALILFACAMLSHPMAVTFPLAMGLIIWWKQDNVAAKEWLMLSPFFVVGIAVSVIAFYLQTHAPAVMAITSTFGKTQSADMIGFGIRAVVIYTIQILLPIWNTFDYPRFTSSIHEVLASALAILAAMIALWTARRKIGRGPVAAAAMFVLLLLPMLGILDAPAIRYSFVADFRAYLPSAVLIALVVGGIAMLAKQLSHPMQVGGSVLAGAVILSLLVTSTVKDFAYQSPLKLWAGVLRGNQSSVLAADQYGQAVRDIAGSDTQLSEARRWFEHAQKLAPGDPAAKYNLGVNDEAEEYNASKVDHIAEARKFRTRAKGEFESALALDPTYPPAALELGDMLAKDKDQKGAVAAYRQALAGAPLSIRARLDLAGALRRDNQLDAAEQVLLDTIDIDSQIASAHTELGNVYLQRQQLQAALDAYADAVRMDPYNTTVLLNYGAVLDSSGQSELASRQFLGATKLDPDLAVAFIDLGRVYLKLGRRQDAEIVLERAVAIDNKDPVAQKLLADAIDAVKRLGPGTQPTSRASSQPTMSPTTMQQ